VLAEAEPDTAGSQFFVTLLDEPSIEGTFTVLGAITSGDEVLDRLARGTIVRRIAIAR
jgi:cyclophilin family peptidyl-prolyl cis-trans isomerase